MVSIFPLTLSFLPNRLINVLQANLPDGSYMIVNGAKFGAGGFANANNPNFKPVLYDPSLPLNQRMTELSSTNIARLYHSEAVTMPDGSVLISGSDPLDPNFPEEYRIEHYLPPYLTSGLPRPAFTISITDWNYSGVYDITVTAGSTANLRVSLIGGKPSTSKLTCQSDLFAFRSFHEHPWQHYGHPNHLPYCSMHRQRLQDHRPSGPRRLPTGMVHAFRPRWTDTLSIQMGQDRRRPREAGELATW
jgi:hypothetical protein